MSDLLISLGRLLFAFFLVFMNGVFVAAEFAFVRVRSTRIETLVEEGHSSAELVQEIITDLDGYLAVSQLGITLSSLGLGWAGEPAIADLIHPLLGMVLPEAAIHAASIALGFGVITFLHVVFGELAPKTFSIQDAERVAFIVSRPMKLFYIIFMPGVVVFNGTANRFTSLVGYAPASETEARAHTEKDLRLLIARSREQGLVERDEERMIKGVFALDTTTAREVMVPRPDVETVLADHSIDELLTITGEGNHTSYPVLNRVDGETVLGAVHVEDLVRAAAEGEDDETSRSRTARDLAREVLSVPENRSIDDLLSDFQTQQIQMAVVFDEWGSFEGIVTMEDILEKIVGEIRDEFDTEAAEPSISPVDDGYLVDGRVLITRLNEVLDTGFESESFETTGGLLLDQLGRAPSPDDRIQLGGYTFSVEKLDGTRISAVRIRETQNEASDDVPGDDIEANEDG